MQSLYQTFDRGHSGDLWGLLSSPWDIFKHKTKNISLKHNMFNVSLLNSVMLCLLIYFLTNSSKTNEALEVPLKSKKVDDP